MKPRPAVSGIDRMVRNVETGHFERSLSALTAAGALVTAAEIFFEHESASFGNKMMWLPVVPGPGGGWANPRYNMDVGPPLLAPLLVTMVGGMGLLAAILRREQ